MATAAGVAWGYVTVVTRSVVPAMVLHYMINVALGLMLQTTFSDPASTAIFGSLTIVYPILTILTVRWLAKRRTKPPQPA